MAFARWTEGDWCSSGKNLWTEINDGEPIELYRAKDATDEAEHVVKAIRRFTNLNSKTPLFQVAILYRTNAQCNSPFSPFCDTSPLDSSSRVRTGVDECRDQLPYLRWH